MNRANIDYLLSKLAMSTFRTSFKLKEKDIKYIDDKGLDVIKSHAYDFINKRLARADIPNDGKQTPTKGHPIFIGQHATATCCRGCLSKWHHINEGRSLTPEEVDYVVEVLMTWVKKQYNK